MTEKESGATRKRKAGGRLTRKGGSVRESPEPSCWPLRSVTTVTAQINDVFRYQKREYAVAGISEGELFDPSLLDLEPAATCTACWRGYQAVFGLSGCRLVLDT